MNRYRIRLFLGIFSFVFIILLGSGLIMGLLLKTVYIHSIDPRMNKETALIASFIEENGGVENFQGEKLESYGKTLNSRLTVIDKDGRILFDRKPWQNGNDKFHFATIERVFLEKIGGEDGEEKAWHAEGDNLYFWHLLENNGKKEGYLFLSVPVDEVQYGSRQIWWILGICLGIALIAILYFAFQITDRYTKPIESATKAAIELAKGNYRARTYEEWHSGIGMLGAAINTLARNLQVMVKNQEVQQNRLETLIENMGSGLLLIDPKGFISLTNRTYREVFQLDEKNERNKLYYEVIPHQEINDMIKEIFMTEQKTRRQILLPLNIERRYFDVYGVPILDAHSEWKGVVLVFHDITELKKLEQMRKDFVANVSHELKTPITSIKGFSETLLDGAMHDQNTLEEFLQIILKESDRLKTLIQDLLDLSKIEQQGFQLSIQTVDLIELLDEVISMVSGRAEEKNIYLSFENRKEKLFIEGDNYRLKQVFLNIVTNAINYTPDFGKVELSLDETADAVKIKVKDTGIGIAKDEIPRIFERFYRVDKDRSRNSGGTGLGLAIVKHLVDAHCGKISVDSTPGQGTTFIIELQKKFPREI